MTQPQRVRPLVEGALLALITAMMGALAIYFLPVKFLVDYIWGIPIIIIIKRYDFRTGMLTLITTFLITWMLTDPVTTLLLILELAPLAIAYGLLFKHEISPGTVLLIGSAVSILSTALTVLGFIYIAKINVLPSEEVLRTQVQQSAAIYTKLGIVSAQEAKAIAESTVKLTLALIPSVLAVASIVRSFFTYIITVKVFRKLNYKANPLPPFSEWSLPWYSIWFVIAGLGLSIIGDQYKLYSVAVAGKNLVFIVFPMFFMTGLSVTTYFVKSWKIPLWMKLFMGIFAFVNFSGTIVLLTLLGLFDPVVSFRKRKKPSD